MAYFTPAELPENKYYLFGKEGGKKLASEYDLPFLGQIPLIQSIREGGDEGVPAMVGNDVLTKEAFTKVVSLAVRQIAVRNADLPKTQTITVEQDA
jgi:ATP-binding protein involved in chromosome partitioning